METSQSSFQSSSTSLEKKQQELHGFEKRFFIKALSCSEPSLLKNLHIPKNHPPNILKTGILVFGSEVIKAAIPVGESLKELMPFAGFTHSHNGSEKSMFSLMSSDMWSGPFLPP